MATFAQIAQRHGLALVEDCCHSHLATCAGRPVGTFGAAGAFSFYPTKNLGAIGDAGAVITTDKSLADRVRRLRNGGQATRYDHVEAGVNSRLDELQAAVLRARLPFLRGVDGSSTNTGSALPYAPLGGPGCRTARARPRPRVSSIPSRDRRRRPALQAHLASQGFDTLIHYPVPIPRLPALASVDPADCPVASQLCDEVLSLPLYPSLTDDDVSAGADAVCRFASRRGAGVGH